MFKIEQIIYIKMDLALNNLQRLICHKPQQTKPNQTIKIYGSARYVAVVIFIFYPGLYKETHVQSVYSAIRRKLKPGWIIIINLFRQRISSKSPSHPTTPKCLESSGKRENIMILFAEINLWRFNKIWDSH